MSGKQTHVIAVSLPKELFRELEKLRSRLFRKRSEIVKEAVRLYVERYRQPSRASLRHQGLREDAAPYDTEPLTPEDEAAFRRGEDEYHRGEFVTLEELRAALRKRGKRNVAARRR